MAREVKEDFAALAGFVADYRIGPHASEARFLALLSRQHKRYFALLVLLGEMQSQKWTPAATSTAGPGPARAEFDARLAEHVSDVGNFVFLWAHGAYKSARLMLRSGIENFVKAIGVLHEPRVITTRSAYEVFDIAEALPFFADPAHKARFERLRDSYSTLSSDVHTATRASMQHAEALRYFPRFEMNAAKTAVDVFDRATTETIALLCLMYPELYHAMHYRNRDSVNVSMDASARETLNRQERS